MNRSRYFFNDDYAIIFRACIFTYYSYILDRVDFTGYLLNRIEKNYYPVIPSTFTFN